MVFWLQIMSVLTGLIAAMLWLLSAVPAAPPMTYEGIDRLKRFLDRASRLNKWAAGGTAASVLFSAMATLLAAMSGRCGPS